MRQWRKPWLIMERSFLEEAVPQYLKELLKDLVGAHISVSALVIGVRGMENRALKTSQQSLAYLHGCRVWQHFLPWLWILPVSAPFFIRNHFQQRKEMEGDPAFLPHNLAEFWDGEEEHWGPCSRGSSLPCGGVKKNQGWVTLLCITDLNSCLSSLVTSLETFQGWPGLHCASWLSALRWWREIWSTETREVLCICALLV